MRTLQHPFFLVCLGLWLLNQLLELNHIYIRLLHSYLDDLLCFPLILTFILAVQRFYFRDNRLTMPVLNTLLAVAAFSVCFELVLPLFSKAHTADALDILAYGIGATSFHLVLNKPICEQLRKKLSS